MTVKVSNLNRQLSNRDASDDIALANKEINWLSLNEKLVRFDLQLHGGEMIVDQPLGNEFGAQAK